MKIENATFRDDVDNKTKKSDKGDVVFCTCFSYVGIIFKIMEKSQQ